MMRSIVAALDGSPESLAALQQAAEWAERLDAELRGIYVEDQRRLVTFPTYSETEGAIPKPVSLPAAELKAAEEALRAEGEQLRTHFNKAAGKRKGKSEFIIVRGRVNDLIVAEARSADMTVIGQRGKKDSPASREPGATTEEVIHEALRPVLVVPKGGNVKGPVLAAFDGSRGVHRVVVAGAQLAAARKAPVTVLTVADDPEDGAAIQEPLRRYLAAYGVKLDCRVVAGENRAEELILATAKEIKAGMVMMGAYSRHPLKEFFFGSVTHTVLSEAPCPVLMMT
jgi:nucleotide-binding universal stress UspA family protein